MSLRRTKPSVAIMSLRGGTTTQSLTSPRHNPTATLIVTCHSDVLSEATQSPRSDIVFVTFNSEIPE